MMVSLHDVRHLKGLIVRHLRALHALAAHVSTVAALASLLG